MTKNELKLTKTSCLEEVKNSERELIVQSSKLVQPSKPSNYNMGEILNQIITEKKNLD